VAVFFVSFLFLFFYYYLVFSSTLFTRQHRQQTENYRECVETWHISTFILLSYISLSSY
jgi:ABC-type spermidine/putrescine transport system permease subunit I